MSLIIWVLCGVISIFGAQTYAELGCMIPKAGGDYEYILAAFGGLWGFLFVWAQLIIIIPTANAVAALTFADYMLQPIFSTCDPPNTARIMLAASAVCKRFIFIVFFPIRLFNFIFRTWKKSNFNHIELCERQMGDTSGHTVLGRQNNSSSNHHRSWNLLSNHRFVFHYFGRRKFILNNLYSFSFLQAG